MRCRRCRCASARNVSDICRRVITCIGRCRRGMSSRSGAIRTVRPIRRGCRRVDAEAVQRAMETTNVVAFADRPVTELSGGERSRVALARVLAVEAPVLLADEPIASLDPRYQIDVMRNLRGAADRGGLVVVVTHDLGLAARFADIVLVLSDGKLVAQGKPDQALSESIMADVFRISAYRAEYRNEDGDTALGGGLSDGPANRATHLPNGRGPHRRAAGQSAGDHRPSRNGGTRCADVPMRHAACRHRDAGPAGTRTCHPRS